MTVTSKKPSLSTKIAYGFGASAYGIKDNGFGFFLLLFYGTVIGLDQKLVGLAILIALVFDALSDPLVGYWSDNFRSRWGRRHPFMYAAALPVAFSYFLLWNPPDWGETGLFWYLLTLAIMIRTLITFYETPSSALMPELTENYEERTTVQTYRLFFAWVGGNFMTLLMWGVLLVATARYPVGTLNRDGYESYGVIASIFIFVAIMVSALGTHGQIKHLRQPSPREKRGVVSIFAEIFETLKDKSFFALFLATLFGAIASGFAASLSFLMLPFFWQFSGSQIFIWTALVFVSALVALIIAPKLVKRFGKKNSVIGIGIVAFTVAPMPVLLRLLDLLPQNGDPMLFPIVAAVNTVDLGLIIAFQSIMYSMIADLVEKSELRTGRRSEGVFFAAVTFTRKSSQGIGAAIAGFALSAIAFPQGEAAASASDEKLWQFGAIYAPTLWILWGCMLVAIRFYKIDKQGHEANLRALADKEAAGNKSATAN